MTRSSWKAWYRMLRIARREALKARVDAITFGAGYVRISASGDINHILPEAVIITGEGECRLRPISS